MPFHKSISDIESTHGAVDHRLAEQLLGLGLAYRRNGDTEEAAAAFRRALHVNRIHKGLHHRMHIPIVDLLIESYAKLADWRSTEQQHRFRYWIHRRQTDLQPEEFVEASMAFASWETQSYLLDTGVPSFRKLRDAQNALDAAYAAVQSDTSQDKTRLIPILNAQARAHLNLAMYVSDTDEDPGTGGRRAGDDFGDIIERRNIILESFTRGKAALEEVISLTQAQNMAIEQGLAMANLADWELVFDRPQSSAKNYRQAYRLLEAAGLPESDLRVEFGRPRQMSEFTVARRTDEEIPTEPPQSAFVVASFKVTTTGKVRSIEIMESNPAEQGSMARRARAMLRASTFRPSIDRDGPVEASSTIRYVFTDESI